MEFDPVTQAMAQAKEQLCVAMESQHQETQLQNWVKEDQESWRREGSTVVVFDKESAVEAAEKAVVEIGMRYWKVSLLFLWQYSEFNLSFLLEIG